MTAVDENRLKGNRAATHVAARLSGTCLVRPVAMDTDVGVDLYCETVEEGRPFLHFWVQVKSGAQCRVSADGLSAVCSFTARHLEYWMRQPVPVFAALVPIERPEDPDPPVYIVDVTTQLLEAGLPRTQNTTFRSNLVWPASEQDSVSYFLREVVPTTSARLQAARGIIESIPTPQPEYVQYSPIVPVLRFRQQITFQLRRTAARAVEFLFRRGELNSDPEFRRLMAGVVAAFGDRSHWESFFAQALSHHADGEFEHAITMYQEAEAVIQRDERVNKLAEWIERTEEINRLKACAGRREPVPTPGDSREVERRT